MSTEPLTKLVNGERVKLTPAEELEFRLSQTPEEPTKEMLRQEAARRAQALVEDYDEVERETWPTQIKEAEAFSLNPLTITPFLSGRATERTVAQLSATVLRKSAALSQKTGQIYGALDQLLKMDPRPTD